ncbi:proteinral transcription factor ii-i repeat domain-containing protein 2 [Plakobranchus ocellatus]|uniref:Proteinral transcription factor ii-i repeat domain-containing protein 2 n=1 Tax=Plakobranchus ocellatus TaxID=259542 RepID=A0AAV3YF36_9GAST|nr:proteinral transcription factor ii-i repeat domain-containing protein 2 [Plakobranchus ocellatus]
MDGKPNQSSNRKRKWYKQSFKDEWLKDLDLKEWLVQDSVDKDSSFCKSCKTTIKNSNKSMLLRHKESTKHKESMRAATTSVSISNFMVKASTTEDEQIAKSELQIAAYFVEHNIPMATVDHFLPVLKKVCPDSKIAQKLSLKRTKLSYTIQDGIAFHEKLNITDICRKQKFSIIIDESTDISVTQVLAIVCRYFDMNQQNVVDALLDAITVENGTAQGLYEAVKQTLQDRNIPLTNIIGFASDNCSTMMGSSGGFQKLLCNDIPSVFIMGCVCHSFALCASHAVSVLPSFLEAFLRDLTSYFSRSSKRQRDFTMIQDVVDMVNHKIPKLSQTRWLSRENVIKVILEQYEALLLYFQSEAITDKVDGANRIYDTLNNRGTKHMLLFLQYVLQKVNKLNLEFQSERFRLHMLYTMVTSEYKTFLSFFIRDEVLLTTKIQDIDPSQESLHRDLGDIYLGGKAIALLLSEPLVNEACNTRFKIDCKKFLVELCVQMKKRFSFNEEGVISQLKILDPDSAAQSPTSIVPLAVHFPNIVPDTSLNDIDDQWRSFRVNAKNLHIPSSSIPQYWFKLREIKDGLGNCKYDILSDFMVTLTALPHSSACVERIFSLMNSIKTKCSNSLRAETVKDRLLAKQSIIRNNSTCVTWDPSEQLVKEMVSGVVSSRYTKRMNEQKEQHQALRVVEARPDQNEIDEDSEDMVLL